ncbi:MAG: DMT family transporter [Armatimonadetes bacterium]|nr:DMT family transporter [Armatimonadota bacterium]
MSPRLSALGSLLVVMLIWGNGFVAAKLALLEVPPLLFALLRFGLASALLVPLAQARGGLALLPRPLPLGTLALMGLTGITLTFVTINFALTLTSASSAAMIQGAGPAITAGLAIVFLGERFSRNRALGIGTSALGVALIVLAANLGTGAGTSLLGDLLMLSGTVSWAVYTILSKGLKATSRLAVTTYSTVFGTLLLVPLAAYDLAIRPPATISPISWLAVLYVGAGSSALGYVLWNRALRALDASQVMNFLNLIPVLGVASAALILGEAPLPVQLFGSALVLAGVWWSSHDPAPRPAPIRE